MNWQYRFLSKITLWNVIHVGIRAIDIAENSRSPMLGYWSNIVEQFA